MRLCPILCPITLKTGLDHVELKRTDGFRNPYKTVSPSGVHRV